MARLDAQQRRILALVSETEWRTSAAIAAKTSLYRPTGIGRLLGQFAVDGLIERRPIRGHRNVYEWRRLPMAAVIVRALRVESHP